MTTPTGGEARPDRWTGWPVRCPVDGRWLNDEGECPDCGSQSAPLRALNDLAAALLEQAAGTLDPRTAAALVAQAAALVPSTENFEVSAADALERGGRPDLALERLEVALRIAPRRPDLQARARDLRGRRPPGPARGSRVAARGWLGAAAVVLVALGALGGGLLTRSSPPAGTASTSGQPVAPPSASAIAAASPTEPAPATTPVAASTPAPTPTDSPAPGPVYASRVRAALAADPLLADANLAIEQVGPVVRVSGPLADAAGLAHLKAVIGLAAPGVRTDLSGVTITAPRYVYVQPGDTLWSIAARTYGSPRKWPAIAAANPAVDPSSIQSGQRLVLP